MAKTITEILEDINKDLKNAEKYIKQKEAIKTVFQYAYMPDKKFLLPDGDPPFKPTTEPLGMSPTNLYTELRRFYVFTRTDMKSAARERIFVEMLEAIHPSEARLMLAIKDQKLTKLYPKLTKKWGEAMNLLPPALVPPAKTKT